MYRSIRNLHLILGVFVSIPLIVYGVSAVQMAHPKWLPTSYSTARRSLELPPLVFNDARALSARLVESYGVRGELEESEVTADQIHLTMFRPGAVNEVNYTRHTGLTTIETRVNGIIAMMNRLHHLAGVTHEGFGFNVWGWLLGLVSIALIVIGISGIYLWFKLHSERVVGVILLTASLGFSLTLIVLLRIP